MDYRLLVDTAVLAGEIMLRNGGETFRVEDTINRILGTADLMHGESVVMTTSIVVSLSDPSIDAITVVRRVSERGTNLNKIYCVNEVSRQFCSGKIDLNTAYEQLQVIQDTYQYSARVKRISLLVACVAFSVFFGGSWKEGMVAIACGMILNACIYWGKRVNMNLFMIDLVGSFLLTIITILAKVLYPSLKAEAVIIASIMPLVPGVAITNAVRDTLQGDYMSGGAKGLEAVIKACSIALGVGAGIYIGLKMTGGLGL